MALDCYFFSFILTFQPQPVKHFALKRKPKSATLRADLLSKSADAVSHLKKNAAPTVPVRSRGMPRKMTDTSNYFKNFLMFVSKQTLLKYFVLLMNGFLQLPLKVFLAEFQQEDSSLLL